jgi:hypothetical protein
MFRFHSPMRPPLQNRDHIVSKNAVSYALLKTLVRDHRVSGVQVHDARLIAVMKIQNIDRIMTFNVRDLTRFSEIEAIHPDRFAAQD